MTSKVSEVDSGRLGRGLVVNSKSHHGETILHLRDPYLLILENASLDRVCSYCLYQQTDLKKCSRCKVPRYCSVRCQQLDWETSHKQTCKIYASLQPKVLPTEVRAVMQILLHHTRQPSDTQPWQCLISHERVLSQKKRLWEQLVLQATAAINYARMPRTLTSMAIGILCRMSVNAFRITLADESPVGMCFDPMLALINHSCAPNAHIIFDGRQCSIRALSDIAEGEQIFVSYIDPTQPRETRKKELEQRYHFICSCAKCEDLQSPYEAFEQDHVAGSSQLELLVNSCDLHTFARVQASKEATHFTLQEDLKLQALSKDPASDSMQSVYSSLSRHKKLIDTKKYAYQPIPTIIYNLYLHYLSINDYASAISLLLFKFFNCDIYNYNQAYHPTRVVALYTVARLLKTLADTTASSSSTIPRESFVPTSLSSRIDFISAHQVVMILVSQNVGMSHGLDSKFAKEVHQELNEVETVQEQRGDVGKVLRNWQDENEGSVSGARIAERLFDDLRLLTACAEDHVGKLG